jgi:hypothetical protein
VHILKVNYARLPAIVECGLKFTLSPKLGTTLAANLQGFSSLPAISFGHGKWSNRLIGDMHGLDEPQVFDPQPFDEVEACEANAGVLKFRHG